MFFSWLVWLQREVSKLQQNCSPNLYHSVVLKDEMRRDPDLQGKDFKMFSMQENLRIDPMLVQWISLNFNVKNYYCELLDSLTLSCFALEGSSFATGITISKNVPLGIIARNQPLQ